MSQRNTQVVIQTSSLDNTPVDTPAVTPFASPNISPLNSGSVTPQPAEKPGNGDKPLKQIESGEKLSETEHVATSNFDANYLAALGRDGQSISIRVDGRKRARNLLKRIEGRSEAGGVLGNLIRLQSIMASDQNSSKGVNSQRKEPKRPPPTHKHGLSSNRSWSSLPGIMRAFKHPSTSSPQAGLHDPEDNFTNNRPLDSFQESPAGVPNTSPKLTLPKSYSSARLSALMMTPEALAKNGIIPPPSTQSSLMRMDKRFSSGYFDFDSSSPSPASSPLMHPADKQSQPLLSEERSELVDKIAAILEKQDFLMHLARAWHAFGSPAHRMETNLLEVARYLDIEACFFTVPGLTLISFGDPDTHSSDTHIVRASDGYDMYRLEQANQIARKLRKSKATVHESIRSIESLLAAPPLYPWYLRIMICFVQSFFVSTTLFHGSWREAAVSGALALVVAAFELLSSRYLTIGYLLNVLPPLIVALVTALLSDHLCFAAVPMAATINLLPGLGLALAMLELSSSNVICGAVRLVTATMTSFMLGWGTIVGHNLGMAALGKDEENTSFSSYSSCNALSMWWWFLFVPLSTIGFSVWFNVHWKRWPAMIIAAASGLVIQTYCDKVKVMRPISAGIASFAVGVFGNCYGRVFLSPTNADIVFVGIIQLVPGSTGVRSFISLMSEETSASSLTMNMLSASISIAAGLLLSNGALYSELK
ncbi:pheromone-regulated protein prm10, partial [Coemansia sp. RSA 2607]